MVIAADSYTTPIIAMLGVTGGLINAVQTTMYAVAAQIYPTVVRATGGLNDTIDEEVGFKFAEYSGRALLEAVRAAGAAFDDPDRWSGMIRAGMLRDFSWKASAGAYSGLYRRLLARP